ncbi:hypothetical protein EU527_09745 [Candidatus Thorarchaeota archaeon]|nr:MAG: hypothetical protein EU527_09745 [Candidatus Thorarchaeota archaeon]
MTQSDLDDSVQEDTAMSHDGTPNFEKKLSPSAQAILKFVKTYEEGGKINVFTEDAEFALLRQIVTSYRGSLYSLLIKRLKQVIHLGGVEIVTQRDIMSLIVRLHEDNISFLTKNELPFLECTIESPSDSIKSISDRSNLSYAQARRAQKRLNDTGILKIGGMLNTTNLGLDRILVILESPTLVLSGPYCQKILFIDGSPPIVLIVAYIPHSKKEDFLDTIRSIRDATTNVTAWNLSAGYPRFSSMYFDKRDGWNLDLLHFRLMLRKGGDSLTLANVNQPSTIDQHHFTYADTLVMDALVKRLDGTAADIAENTKISQTTAFRKRNQLLRTDIIQPRAQVNIPHLGDRVISLLSPECAGNVITAWGNLPVSYQSRIQNLENASEKKVLLSTALPTGSGQDLIDVLKDEISKVHDYSVHKVAAGFGGNTKVSSMFDRRNNQWKWDVSRHFDAVSYSVVRKEATSRNIPLDLA